MKVLFVCLLLLLNLNYCLPDGKFGISSNSQNFDLVLKSLGIFLSFSENDIFTDILIIVPHLFLKGVKTNFSLHSSLFTTIRSCTGPIRKESIETSVLGNLLIAYMCDSKTQSNQGHLADIVKVYPEATFLFSMNSRVDKEHPYRKMAFLRPWITVIPNDDNDKDFSVFENFRPKKNSPVISTFKFGINARNFSIHPNEEDPSRMFSEGSRSNFQKLPFRIAAVMDFTYAYDTNITRKKDVKAGNSSSYEYHDSFAIEILRSLEVMMNFTTELKVADAWGHLDSNKTWIGMISLLLQDEADLAISSTADLPFRRQMVDFNMATSELRLTAFFRQPRTTSQTNALLQPFQSNLWMAIFIWLVVGSLTLICFKAILMRNLGMVSASVAKWKNDYLWDNADCFQWAVSTVCLQGFYSIPTLACYRFVVGVGYFCGMLLYAAYAGTLISFLSVVVEPIKSMDQLLATNFKFSVENSPIPLKFLSESPSPQVRNLYERRKEEPKYESTQQASASLAKGSFVFVVNDMNGYESLNTDFKLDDACHMREIRIQNGEQKQSSMVRKGASFKRTIDFQILRMWEYGLVKKWKKKYLQTKPKCDTNHPYEGVNFRNVFFGFLVLLFGAGFAICLIILEILSSKFSSLFKFKNRVLHCKRINLNIAK